jgi:hypothetical protein
MTVLQCTHIYAPQSGQARSIASDPDAMAPKEIEADATARNYCLTCARQLRDRAK